MYNIIQFNLTIQFSPTIQFDLSLQFNATIQCNSAIRSNVQRVTRHASTYHILRMELNRLIELHRQVGSDLRFRLSN